MANLRAPFPYFGGKATIAPQVWEFLGDVYYYIEPFCGSAAVLLARPHTPQHEIVNDADCYIANFWRAVKWRGQEVAEWADWPTNHCDLTARHRWLVHSEQVKKMKVELLADPDYCDPKIAGWWCWGLSSWIGSGWCQEVEETSGKIPHLWRPKGVRKTSMNPGKIGQPIPTLTHAYGTQTAIGKPIPTISWAVGTQAAKVRGDGSGIYAWFARLQARLANVRVVCGDWKQVCSTPSILNADCGIFLDPPYGHDAGRDNDIYRMEANIGEEIQAFCVENQAVCRIVLAGYEGEHNVLTDKHGWRVVEWRAQGGYGNQVDGQAKANRHRERLWISPKCLTPGLF